MASIEYGSIGWDDDDDYIYPGEEGNDGHTLIKVQLFRGRDVTKPLKDRAQGHRLIAHINSLGGFRTPPYGTRCLVAIPEGAEMTPGSATIVALHEKSSERLDNLPNGSYAMSAGQGQARVVANNDGSVTLFTTSDNTNAGKSVYVRVAKDGIQFVAPWGTLRFDDTGFHVLHSSGASFDLGGIYGLPAPLDALTSYAKLQAASIIGEGVTQSFGTGTEPPDALVGQDRATPVLLAMQDEITKISQAITAIGTAFMTAAGAFVGAVMLGPEGQAVAHSTALANSWVSGALADPIAAQVATVTNNAPVVINGIAALGTSTNST